MTLELTVQNEKKWFRPVVLEGVVWQTERSGSPGQLSFSVAADNMSVLNEGNRIVMTIDKKAVFVGFLFEREWSKEGVVSCLAYDQLRYLKNKDSYALTNVRADELVRRIAGDFSLKVGVLADTKCKIESFTANNQSLLDMIETALSVTQEKTGKDYILFDEEGLLQLRDVADMRTKLLLHPRTAEEFHFCSSIDRNAYNQVKLVRNRTKTAGESVCVVKDAEKVKKWGVLQHYENVFDDGGIHARAQCLLTSYNRVSRTLSVSGAAGNPQLRAGCSVWVQLPTAGGSVRERALCGMVRHRFYYGAHLMDLTLKGGNYDE